MWKVLELLWQVLEFLWGLKKLFAIRFCFTKMEWNKGLNKRNIGLSKYKKIGTVTHVMQWEFWGTENTKIFFEVVGVGSDNTEVVHPPHLTPTWKCDQIGSRTHQGLVSTSVTDVSFYIFFCCSLDFTGKSISYLIEERNGYYDVHIMMLHTRAHALCQHNMFQCTLHRVKYWLVHLF